jgi:hypothetical protein
LLPRLLGLARFPAPDTLRRFFHGFTYRRLTEASEALMQVSLSAMRPILLGHTLDLDSTVLFQPPGQASVLLAEGLILHQKWSSFRPGFWDVKAESIPSVRTRRLGVR